jgi:D-serine deaminase-like pyridoxal phosphate-dependent protein
MDTSFTLLGPSTPMPPDQHERLVSATNHLDAPVAVLDLHALSANAHSMVQRAAGKPVRVASKSIRSTAVLRALLDTPGYAGVLAFSLHEAIMLVETGVTDDVVVAYPTMQRQALQRLLASAPLLDAITLMVDHPGQLRVIQDVGPAVAPVRICLDLDMSLRIGPLHIGARRSPVHRTDQVVAAAEFITANSMFRLVGLMGYEAQIAGVPDDSPLVTLIKRLSAKELRARRGALVAAVQRVLGQRGMPSLEFVNGGGTGSIEATVTDEAVTEVAAGSGIYGPHLFDRYHTFQPHPAALFGLDVTRHPAPGIVTVQGGGWVASGAPGADRLPLPIYPRGLRYVRTEGAGEVQTPLKTTAGSAPALGERVWFRHAKAGELAEHVDHFHIITHHHITATVTTYRGDGHAL